MSTVLILALVAVVLCAGVPWLLLRHAEHPVTRHVRHHSAHVWRRVRATNAALAVSITNGVGTMWCAYVFAALALLGFPGVHATPTQYVQWVSQTFIQLVLLAVIMVGQSVQGAKAEKHLETILARLEKLERQHGVELTAIRTLTTELHAHTRCDGHTTIESEAPKPTVPVPVRARRTKALAAVPVK